jgi:hypothetical protein
MVRRKLILIVGFSMPPVYTSGIMNCKSAQSFMVVSYRPRQISFSVGIVEICCFPFSLIYITDIVRVSASSSVFQLLRQYILEKMYDLSH